jgi:hypothetical protein
MKYALLVYGERETLGGAGRALHDPSAYLTLDTGTARLLAHYRLRAPELTTTIRRSGKNPTRSRGPAIDGRETLCAFFLIESEEEEKALEIASELPAGSRCGGSLRRIARGRRRKRLCRPQSRR